ncbi:MAG: hypothetical protein WKG07_02430 [Hymenobacter sp.]
MKVFDLVAPAAKTPLVDNFGSEADDTPLMAPDKVVAAALKATATRPVGSVPRPGHRPALI